MVSSFLSCVVATLALSAQPKPAGFMLGIPPAPDDPVISHVAPPECLFFAHWNGTASPNADSNAETEKLLAEPEVQEFLRAAKHAIMAALRNQEAKEKAEAQKHQDDAYWNHKRYDRAPVLGPIQPGAPCFAIDTPSEDEVMRRLEKARPVEGGIPFFHEVQRTKAHITVESIADYIDPPRFYPTVGPAQLHHAHFKCTVYYKERTSVGWPMHYRTGDEDCQEVIYIDHEHLHRVGKEAAAVESKDNAYQLIIQKNTANDFIAKVQSAKTPPAIAESKPTDNKPTDKQADKNTLSQAAMARQIVDMLGVLVTHPAAIYLEDVKLTAVKPAEAKKEPVADAGKPADSAAGSVLPAMGGTIVFTGTSASALALSTSDNMSLNLSDSSSSIHFNEVGPDMDIRGAAIVNLGAAESAAMRSKLIKFLKYLRDQNPESKAVLERVKIGGTTWWQLTAIEKAEKMVVTFGFPKHYFVMAIGAGEAEKIMARWNGPTPAWLDKAREQTQVPRRASLLYVNLKAIGKKIVPFIQDDQNAKELRQSLEIVGIDNLDSYISTTGLDEYGLIERSIVTVDGKPHGLLDMVSDRPLAAKDLAPVPANALAAMVVRADLDRALTSMLDLGVKAAAVSKSDSLKALQDFNKQGGADVHRFLAALGDTWCVYNSPTEGEVPFLGWTIVVPIRDRAALLDSWKKIGASKAFLDSLEKANQSSKTTLNLPTVDFTGKSVAAVEDGTKKKELGDPELRKCVYAGHEIDYIAGTAIAPAMCIGEHEMVVTFNMPAMKAYLLRKEQPSLATVPGVALELKAKNPPVAISYYDSPRFFDAVYPVYTLLAMSCSALAQHEKIDLDPTFWPSAPSLRPHMKADISTLERTPHGLQITSRFSLPSYGVSSYYWLMALGTTVQPNINTTSLPLAAGVAAPSHR